MQLPRITADGLLGRADDLAYDNRALGGGGLAIRAHVGLPYLVALAVFAAFVLGSCGRIEPSTSASVATCDSELAKGGKETVLGVTGISVEVPDGWTAQLAESDQSTSLVMTSPDERFAVHVVAVAPELADGLPAIDATVIGERNVTLANGRSVVAELITANGKAGFRVISPISTGAVEIEVLGTAVACERSLLDLLGRISSGT